MQTIKKSTRRLYAGVLSLTLLILSASGGVAHAAATATLALTPTTATTTQGATTAVTIQVNAGTNKITGAQACIKYDAAKLSLINTDTSTSALSYTTPNSDADCKAGELQVSRFSTDKPSGTFTLAKLTFKALGTDTSASLDFNTTSSYIKDDATADVNGTYTSILTGSTGAKIAIGTVPASEASSDPSSPTGSAANKPALTGTNNAQAASLDVQTTSGSSSNTTTKAAANKNDHRNVYIIGWGILALIVAAIVLRRFTGFPNTSKASKTNPGGPSDSDNSSEN